MIFKRKRKEEQNIINCANLQYRKAVDTADLYMKSKEYTITEKQILLDYMIDIIKRDIQSEYIADLFYHDEAKTMRMPMFPEIYYDKDGKEHELKFSENQEISLKEKCVITFPWERKRMSDNIINIVKNGLKISINHDVYYYKRTKHMSSAEWQSFYCYRNIYSKRNGFSKSDRYEAFV